ncbi:phosphotransferase family protein [Nocardioides sp. NPDC101246]|uniref:phosphotransferase family protein n=1 Tax=Nocardioides sp. NPDC101246 TaxID=3364336 RepID=UPI0037FC460F
MTTTTSPAEDLLPGLHAVLGSRYGALDDLTPVRLSSGASRTTWLLPGTGSRPTLFLQQERPGGVPGQSGQVAEIAAIRAARAAGVAAPVVVASSIDEGAPTDLGEFVLVEGLPGRSDPAPLLTEDGFAGARERFAAQVGELLARLHTIGTEHLPEVPTTDPLEFYRDLLDDLGEPHPALEVALAWLVAHRPAPVATPVLVHGDFRVGNLMYDETGLRGVLDWEITHLGDPSEDLGWLCVPSWRFGGAGRAGGVASVHDVLAAYRAAGGRAEVTAERVRWWEVFGTFKWAVICIMQAAAHIDGSERSVELAVLGRRTASVERDLLDLIGAADPAPFEDTEPDGDPGPHDAPDAVGLVGAVREHLAEAVLPELTGRTGYLTRVCLRALATAERELRFGALLAARHRDRLAGVGSADDAALARAIRSGDLDYDQALELVVELVADKLRVSDPRRLSSGNMAWD